MNRLGKEKRTQIIRCLVEGCSIRSTVRITGSSKNTITKLLRDIGKACSEFQDKALVNLNCQRVQCDEIWSFCYSKQKNVPEEKRGQFGVGDVWTWVAIDADTKLAISWLVGNRDGETAAEFINDLAKRITERIQLTTDGHKAYLEAVEGAFGNDIDYAMLIKLYGTDKAAETRYSPAKCQGTSKHKVTGNPNTQYVSTSHVERQNLTIRMSNRRVTRLTNAFSKKIENLIYSVSLHFMYYNFCRIHKTLKVMPAMEAGVTNKLWDIEDVISLLEKKEK